MSVATNTGQANNNVNKNNNASSSVNNKSKTGGVGGASSSSSTTSSSSRPTDAFSTLLRDLCARPPKNLSNSNKNVSSSLASSSSAARRNSTKLFSMMSGGKESSGGSGELFMGFGAGESNNNNNNKYSSSSKTKSAGKKTTTPSENAHHGAKFYGVAVQDDDESENEEYSSTSEDESSSEDDSENGYSDDDYNRANNSDDEDDDNEDDEEDFFLYGAKSKKKKSLLLFREERGNALREYVEGQAREASPRAFAQFTNDAHERIEKLAGSVILRERLAAVACVDQLCSVEFGEEVEKVTKFARYLRTAVTTMRQGPEPVLASAASQALGRLVSTVGAVTADIVEEEVNRAFKWLKNPVREERKRFAAALTLRELAANAPTVFNVHVPQFIKAVWPALHDPSLDVRLAGVLALRACLMVIEQRETRYRVQWYYKLYEEARKGLDAPMNPGDSTPLNFRGGSGGSMKTPNSSSRKTPADKHSSLSAKKKLADTQYNDRPEKIHGSLLAFGELLRHTGEFMLSRYKEVAETVLKFYRSRRLIVRRSVIDLIPKLAAFSPRRFADSYLPLACGVLLTSIRAQGERDAGFLALGDLAKALEPAMRADELMRMRRAREDNNMAGSSYYAAQGHQQGQHMISGGSGVGGTSSHRGTPQLTANNSTSTPSTYNRGYGSGGASPLDRSRSGTPANGSNYSNQQQMNNQQIMLRPLMQSPVLGTPNNDGTNNALIGSGSGSGGGGGGVNSNGPGWLTPSSVMSALSPDGYINNSNGVQTPGPYGTYRSRSPIAVSQITSADGSSVRVNDYSVHESCIFEKPLGSALLRYLPEISAVMYDVFGEGSLNNEERLASKKRRKSMKRENREKRKNRSNNNGEELDGDFDDENAGNGRNKIAKKTKKHKSTEKDENDEEEIRRKQELKLANEKVLRSGVREALRCCGEMAAALQESWKPHVLNVLPAMFAVGLSKSLVSSLETITDALPDLTPQIQSRLFDAVSMATRTTNPGNEFSHYQNLLGFEGSMFEYPSSNATSDERRVSRRTLELALRTMRSFPFESRLLLKFARRNVVQHLDNPSVDVRLEAALTCCHLLELKQISQKPSSSSYLRQSQYNASNRNALMLLNGPSDAKPQATRDVIMERLLQLAVADLDANFRASVLRAFVIGCRAIDSYLSQARSLRALFVALNDENVVVRALAIELIGTRLSPRNPGYCLPALRAYLLQLLAELERSTESSIREESAKLIATLIRACPRLFTPHICPVILKTLTRMLRAKAEESKSSGVGVVDDKKKDGKDAKNGKSDKDEKVGNGKDSNNKNGTNENANDSSDKYYDFNDDDASSRKNKKEKKHRDAGNITNERPNLDEDDTSMKHLNEDPMSAHDHTKNGKISTSDAMAKSSASVFVRTAVSGREKAAAIATIGELMEVGGPATRLHVPELLVLLMQALKSNATRDIAVITLGKLVKHSGYVVAPYADHPQLLPLLLRMVATEKGTKRENVLRTLGILGALDPHAHKENEIKLYGQGLLSAAGVRGVKQSAVAKANIPKTVAVEANAYIMGGYGKNVNKINLKTAGGDDNYDDDDDEDDENSHDLLPLMNLTTASDDFYPTVALNALLRVLRDKSMSSHRHMVVRSVMFIFHNSLGLNCVSYLPTVFPVLFDVMRTCDDALREFMLSELAILVSVIKAHVRRFLPEILEIIHTFWGNNALLKSTLLLCEELSRALRDEFRAYLPELLPRIVAVLADAERSGRYAAVPYVLRALETFGSGVDEHLHLVLPSIVRLFKPGVAPVPFQVRRAVLASLSRLLPRMQCASSQHASAIIAPLARILESNDVILRKYAVDVLISLEKPLGSEYKLFLPSITRVARRVGLRDNRFEAMRERIESGGKFPAAFGALAISSNSSVFGSDDMISQDEYEEANAFESRSNRPPPPVQPPKLVVNEAALRKAWESSQRSTKEDWLEWMRQLSVELLKSSPSPSLRACADLANVQPNVARDLFCESFVSCWAELSVLHREQLVRSMESAFTSPTIPPEIVATLLNLSEFMERDEKPIPVDVRTLGAIAERCRAYAKALHYKELEFTSMPNECVEAIIAINNQLQLPEAALGVLKHLRNKKLEVNVKESWYEKLGQWEFALEAHKKKADELDARAAREAELLYQREVSSRNHHQQYATQRPPSPSFSYHYNRQLMSKADRIAREEASLGQMRCLAALGEWERLITLAKREWPTNEGGAPHSHASKIGIQVGENGGDAIAERKMKKLVSAKPSVLRDKVAPLAARAAWHLGDWKSMEKYTVHYSSSKRDSSTGKNGFNANGSGSDKKGSGHSLDEINGKKSKPDNSTLHSEVNALITPGDGDFYRAVLAFRRGDPLAALRHVDAAREALGQELVSLVSESYDRSYGGVVRAQQLAELEEVVEYAQLQSLAQHDPRAKHRQDVVRQMWRDRIYGVSRDVEVWQSLLAVRSLVLPMSEETNTWLKFASMNRKAGRESQAKRTLVRLLEYDPSEFSVGQEGFGAGSGRPLVMFAYCKHLWGVNSREEAFQRLQSLASELFAASYQREMEGSRLTKDDAKLVSKTFLKLGQWRWELAEETLDDDTISDVLTSFGTATKHSRHWAKAWHNWALFNATAMEHYQRLATQRLNVNEERDALKAAATRHVAPAISGFFRSIALGGSTPRDMGGALQDILRLLTLWFNYGHLPEVEAALVEGFGHVSINTWLAVIPQIVARIHSNSPPVRRLIHRLLVRVGRQHPQALLYPLLVACKSQSTSRRVSATAVLDNLRNHSALLVEQAEVVSLELIRVAIVWHEAWHEALEEASRLYFGEQNVEGMFAVLAPLHHILERTGAETLQEMSFAQAYGRELREAREYCEKFKESGREEDLNQAWDLYYHVFKRINKQLPTLTTLELRYVSHRLLSARDLELSLPGNYIPGGELVTIAWFAPTMHVITSKQRPRRLQIHGSDGKDYGYLLKGHEDLRQDERVMQLFGLVNQLLNSTPSTSRRDLAIARYAVVPLSPNSGLIGWVPNCDTMHVLIREHREARKIPLNLEHRLMLAMAPDYDNLPLVNKVEVFRHALDNTPGNDLAQVLWLKSHSSEQWLDRRTTYTRSLAVMSMVGYLLGLGDRHPSNLMIDRYSGKVLHIDFGDCFEASMHREKFPERVPFRLTRMLVKAMEVSGIEGTFIGTCQRVITVLRNNKDSVLAMLEAFVHDPLINWRLLANQTTEQNESSAEPSSNANSTANSSGSVTPMAGTSSVKSSPLARRHTISRDAEEPASNRDGSSGSGSTTPAGSDEPSGQSSRAPSRTPPPKTPTIPENESFHADLDEKSKAIGVDSRTNTADIIGHNSSSRLDSGSDDMPRTGQKPGAAPMFMDTPSGQVPVSSSVMGATALHAQYENMREFGGGGGTTAVIGTDMGIIDGIGDPTNVSMDESEHGDANAHERPGGGNHQERLNHHSSSYAQRVMHQQLGGGGGEVQHQKQHPRSTAAAAAVAAAAANYGSSMSSFEPEILKRNELIDALDGMNDNEDNMVLNDRAVSVMQRMNDKLTGKDGLIEAGSAADTGDSVEDQVRRLIEKATNHENLCTSYIGWCSFW